MNAIHAYSYNPAAIDARETEAALRERGEALLASGKLSAQEAAFVQAALDAVEDAREGISPTGRSRGGVGAFDNQALRAEALFGDLEQQVGPLPAALAPTGAAPGIAGAIGEAWNATAGGSAGTSSGALSAHISNGARLMEMYETDPAAFAAGWRKLSSEDRTLAMFSMQAAQNTESQLTNLLTNLMRSNHDAVMAVARNIAG